MKEETGVDWKKTIANGFLYGAFVSFVIVSTILLIGRINPLRYKTYEIQGAYYVSQAEVGAALAEYLETATCLRVTTCNHVVYWPGADIRSMLIQKFPRIASVQYGARGDTVILRITERQHSAMGCVVDPVKQCWFMDESGVVFARAPIFARGIYQEFRIAPPTSLPARALPAWLPSAITALEERTHIRLTEIRLSKKAIAGTVIKISDHTFDTNAPQLLFDITDIRTPENMDYLSRVIERLFALNAFSEPLDSGRRLEYIDLRFDGKVFYKFE